MWDKSENGEIAKPKELEFSGNSVILRRRFKRIDGTEEMPEHWEFEEWQMSMEQYAIYEPMAKQIKEQEDAIVELAELIGGGI